MLLPPMRVLLAALLFLAGAARAQNSVKDPGAPWPASVDLPRATAMGGAHAAVSTANDALTNNPAGITQQRRYHVEVDGVLDPHFPAQAVMVSVVDTTSAAVGTGLLFSRWGSGQPGGRGEGWYGALAYAYALGSYHIGGETKYYRFATPDGEAHRFAQDVGLLARRGNFAYGLTVQNLSTSTIPTFPLTTTVGIGWGTDTDWHVAFDYKADLSDLHDVKHKAAGCCWCCTIWRSPAPPAIAWCCSAPAGSSPRARCGTSCGRSSWARPTGRRSTSFPIRPPASPWWRPASRGEEKSTRGTA